MSDLNPNDAVNTTPLAQPNVNTPAAEQNKSVEPNPAKDNHSILPTVLVFLGIIETLWFSYYLITVLLVIPKLSQLYQEVNAKPTSYPYLAIFLLSLFVLFAVAEIIYGFWLHKLQRKQNSLPVKHKRIVWIILALTVLLVILWFISLIYSSVLPIYNLSSAF